MSQTTDINAGPVLAMSGISKTFGSTVALDNVDFELERGEIHALLGVNGAGKSTLIKILSGLYFADAGKIEVEGQEVTIRSPREAIAAGVSAVQQHPELVNDFTGYQNIFLGQESKKTGFFQKVDAKAQQKRAEELLARFPVGIDMNAKISELESVEREIIAILHALKHEGIKIMVLDEPTSTLTNIEREHLFKVMETLKKSGVSIIYITHRLEEVMEIADRFTVFRAGKRMTTMAVADAKEQKTSIPQIMLQEALGELYPEKRDISDKPDPIFEVKNMSLSGALSDVSFSVSKGSVLGIFGLVGSGIEELANCMFGAQQTDQGDIVLKGRALAHAHPSSALKDGIFLVPGDRRTQGLIADEDVTFNTTLANLERASGLLGIKRFFQNSKNTHELAKEVTLYPLALDRKASQFSGGNQQKIVIAKGLYQQGEVYIFLEPTIGVDIGARAAIYALIRKLSASAAVIVLSSDYDEVFGVADEVAALYRGQLVMPPNADVKKADLLAAGVAGEYHA